MTKLITI